MMDGYSEEPRIGDFSEHKEQVLRSALQMHRLLLEECLRDRRLAQEGRAGFKADLEIVEEMLG